MRRLGITGQIGLIIIVVAIATAMISGGLNIYINKARFGEFIASTDQKIAGKLAERAVSYYREHGSLDGLNQIYRSVDPGIWPMEPPKPSNAERRPDQPGKRPPGRDRMSYQVIVTDVQDRIVADSTGRHLGGVWGSGRSALTGYPVKLEDGTVIGHVYIGHPSPYRDQDNEHGFLNQIRLQILVSTIVAALAALLLGVFLARRLVAPITDLTEGIHELARGNLETRVTPHGDRELIKLGSEFNTMAQRLQDNEENRRTFMANIAHEIRTPLAILRGELEAIQSGRIPATDEVVSGMVDEIIRLNRLVKDFESLSLAESGGLKLNREELPVETITETILPLRLMMEQDGLDFQVVIGPGVESVYADPHRLTQILMNLLTNAMKNAGPDGRIVMELIRKESGILCAVRNSGNGIDTKDLVRIFERFYKSDQEARGQQYGTGLGLTITKSYVTAHGGQIWAESEPGQMTAIYFTLPDAVKFERS